MNNSMTIDLDAFEKNYRDAKGYHRRAEQFVQEEKRHSLIFNMASVALERYLIALCELYGEMPFNHNYNSLIDTVENIIQIPPDLNKEIRSLDDIFGICSLENYHHGVPEQADSVRVISMCHEIEKLFDQSRISSFRTSVENNKE
jgi:hypothetical protein